MRQEQKLRLPTGLDLRSTNVVRTASDLSAINTATVIVLRLNIHPSAFCFYCEMQKATQESEMFNLIWYRWAKKLRSELRRTLCSRNSHNLFWYAIANLWYVNFGETQCWRNVPKRAYDFYVFAPSIPLSSSSIWSFSTKRNWFHTFQTLLSGSEKNYLKVSKGEGYLTENLKKLILCHLYNCAER